MSTTSTYTQQNIPKTFPKNVRARRKALSLTQEKLGEIAGVHTNYIGGVEQGTRNCTLKSMMAIANGLNVPLQALMEENYKPASESYALVEIKEDGYKFHDITKQQAEDILNKAKSKK